MRYEYVDMIIKDASLPLSLLGVFLCLFVFSMKRAFVGGALILLTVVVLVVVVVLWSTKQWTRADRRSIR